MKRFAKVLQELMSEQKLTQLEIATLASLEQVKISRLLRSITRADQADLAALSNAFPSPRDRYQLALAHIQDELPADTLKQIEIQPLEHTLRDAPPVLPHDLPPRLTRALAYLLGELPDNESIAAVIIDLAHALGWDERASQPAAKVTYTVRETVSPGPAKKKKRVSPGRLSSEEQS